MKYKGQNIGAHTWGRGIGAQPPPTWISETYGFQGVSDPNGAESPSKEKFLKE